MTNGYPTPDEIRDELPFTAAGLSLSDGEFGALLERLIGEETDRIERWAHVAFVPETVTEMVSGNDAYEDRRELRLSHRPVRDVMEVQVAGEVLDPSAYYVAETHIERTDNQRWPTGTRNISIEYEHGLDDVPGAVRDGLIRLIRSRLEQRASDGLESESGGDTSYSYRPSSEIRAEVSTAVTDITPPSYFGGAQVI